MAKKHIEVNELKEWVENWFYQDRYYHPYSKSNNIPVPELYDLLERMPAADVAPRWIPFTERELTAEEQEEHPDWCYIMECPLPDDGQEVLISDGKWVWQDAFHIDDGCYLDSDRELEGCAWMPLPEPYKGGEEE